jgi:hypothetical protein
VEQGLHRLPAEPLAAPEEIELDEKAVPDQARAMLAYEPARGLGGSTRREDVVHDEHTVPRPHSVPVHLEGVGPVFQLVLYTPPVSREFAWLADRDEPSRELKGDRCTQQKTSRLDGDDPRNTGVSVRRRHQVSRGAERRRVEQQRRDVLEHDARLRKVGHVADRAVELLETYQDASDDPVLRGLQTLPNLKPIRHFKLQ